MTEPTTKPARVGRPKKADDERLSQPVTTALTVPDHDALCAIASQRKVDISVLVRECLRKLLHDESSTMIR